MAARRLIIVMVVMLAISTAAAALAPPREDEGSDEAETTAGRDQPGSASQRTATREGRRGTGGRLLTARVRTGRRVTVVPVRRGDQLRLEVVSSVPGELEIPALGLTDYAGPAAPARFDLLARREGDYVVRRLDSRAIVARIEVGPPRRSGGSVRASGG